VRFCDLVGSTALSARLDPEDMRRVIRAYQDASSGVVARYDGFVAKFMGDGILAYFGFPRAHEDDPAGSPSRSGFVLPHRALGPAKEFNLTGAVFGRECLHVVTTEGKRIQATQTSRRWVRRGRKSGGEPVSSVGLARSGDFSRRLENR
jgi:class 3 adenylate cyclase